MSADVCVFGDWHGNVRFAGRALSTAGLLHPRARLIHVGDFGLYANDFGHRYLSEVDRLLKVPLHVVPGNHEQWPSLRIGSELGFDGHDDDGFLRTPRYPNIRISPRAHVWQWGEHLLAAVTGANSIDFEHRKEGVSWWREESPTSEHVDELVGLVDRRQVDVLITHDGPFEAIEAANMYPPARNTGWSAAALAYAGESAEVVGQARNRTLPTLQVCGHHHVRRSISIDSTVVEFLADDSAGSIRGNRLDISWARPEMQWQ